ncbi:hypothetical protein C8C83_0679 [Flavobacterium sp. 90]|uniref:hypothetical protein n=1 Tax=unclassified Flavobacterium TaxID=196869 RepID=UPI000EAE9B6C|nr:MULTISPECIES: hypothetical protein [unclassified Flavobacterium]RKR09079.1 hypothetical protein C8C82_0977 [Flavobacterium sp. 81]TCK52863.1 hypothetical protein C8C83_0679 [Flavobacterium sp. 90]
MVKAHSLLYAIYICLIVSIICGALLYFSNLYNQLNSYYNLQEELYIQNHSVLNFALGNKTVITDIEKDKNSEIEGCYKTKLYGLFSVVLAQSYILKDTVSSMHFVGKQDIDKNALYLTNLSKSLYYSGKVKLIGHNHLPNTFIETSYINNSLNQLIANGPTAISEPQLPEINPEFKKVFQGLKSEKIDISELEKTKDSLYFNSFFNTTKEIQIKSILSNSIFKGNFILKSADSIRVKKNVVLEDVILIAPKITFEEGFRGTVQAFATNGIELEEKVILNYPSVLCVYNESADESKIKIKKECQITGAVVLFGNTIDLIDKNTIEIDEKGLLLGDLYCSGKLMLKSNVYGSVYVNRFFMKTASSTYENMISDIEINIEKRPAYFISIPLFNTQKATYGVIKKVL